MTKIKNKSPKEAKAIDRYDSVLIEGLRYDFKAVAEAVEHSSQLVGKRLDSLEVKVDSLEVKVDFLDTKVDKQGVDLRAAIGLVEKNLRQEMVQMKEELSDKIDKIAVHVERHEVEITHLKEAIQ